MSKSSPRMSSSNKERILCIVTGGICLALSFVLSQIKIFEMPMGGTITPAATLPLILFCLCFGPIWGFVVCFVFSLLQLIGGYLLFPMQVVLDYILAYTCVGIAGFAAPALDIRQAISSPIKRLHKVNLIKASLLVLAGFVLRFACSVISGVIFYAEYAGEMNVWVYSITYNGSFVLPEAVITIAVLCIFSGAIGLFSKNKSITSK